MVSRYEYSGRQPVALAEQKTPRPSPASGQRKRVKTQKIGSALSGRALRRRVKAVFCGLVFLALFGLRLAFPTLGDTLDEKLLSLIDGGWDYKNALETVGSFASGDGAFALSDLFGGEKAKKAAFEGTALENAQETLRQDIWLRFQEDEGQEEAETDESPDALAVFLESQADFAELAVPADASFEMPELGLRCTAPLSGTVTDGFGWRTHPISGEVKFHYGTDIGAEAGTEIGAFADGTVYAVGDSASLGLYIILEHEGGLRSLYAHCQEILAQPGAAVGAGERIALVGSSGVTTGPHLHLELEKEGLSLNPEFYVSFGERGA